MAADEAKKVEPPTHTEPDPEPVSGEAPIDMADDSKALVLVQTISADFVSSTEAPEPAEEKKGSIDRDVVLEQLTTQKRLSLIKAWEESEKSIAENKAQKKLSSIVAWENSKKASLVAELKNNEEQLEKKKAGYIEKMKNKVAQLHKSAEEKRAITEAARGEDLLKAEEMAAKYNATGTSPKKFMGCF